MPGLFISPRLHRRGPIEAMGSQATAPSGLHDLHAFTGVAQLKLELCEKSLRDGVNLHAFTGVAQLKQEGLGFLGAPLVISTPSPAWPN